MSPNLLWTGHYEPSPTAFNENSVPDGTDSHSTGTEHEVGNTWGFKSESGALALIWFEGAKHNGPDGGVNDWAFDFGLIDFSRPGSLDSA
jgi:hypothetical protein